MGATHIGFPELARGTHTIGSMNHRSAFWLPVLLLALTAACGDSFSLDEDGTGGSGTGGSGTGGNGTGGSGTGGVGANTGTGGTGADTGTGATGANTGTGATDGGFGGTGAVPNECDSYRSLPIDSVLYTVEIVNARTTPIYIGDPSGASCTGPKLYQLATESGEPLATEGGLCGGGCDTTIDSGPLICAMACMPSAVLRIDAGASWKGSWDGGVWDNVTLPARCVGGEFGGGGDFACQRQVPAPAGPLVFSSVAYTESSCLSGGAADCLCQPLQPGQCQTYNATPTGTKLEAVQRVDGPGSVKLIFTE